MTMLRMAKDYAENDLDNVDDSNDASDNYDKSGFVLICLQLFEHKKPTVGCFI